MRGVFSCRSKGDTLHPFCRGRPFRQPGGGSSGGWSSGARPGAEVCDPHCGGRLALVGGSPVQPGHRCRRPFGQATPGGTFTGAWVGPCCVGIANANPLIAGGDQHFLSKIYEPLVTYSIDPTTDGYGPIVRRARQSWETSTDGLTWTFHLQPDVTWQDGTPFTADDVVFTLTLCETKSVGCVYGGGITNITGAADVKAGTATTLSGRGRARSA